MYRLGLSGLSLCRRHRLSARSLCLTAQRPAINSSSREVDELVLDTYSAAEQTAAAYTSPITGTTAHLTPSPFTSSVTPLADTSGDAASLLSPHTPSSDFVSPFSSIDQVDFTNLTEPAFTSLGLAHGWPHGYLQSLLELLHIDLGLPWWQAIVATTVCLRVLVFPIMVLAQRNMARVNNHLPTLQKLQIEAQLAAMRGNTQQSLFAQQAVRVYCDEHNVHPVKNMFPMYVNGLVLTTMFFALRGMCAAPVGSMTTGGTAWFTDLVATDPTFLLPLTAAGTIALMMYLGADGINLDTMPPIMKKVLILMPIVSIPIMISFPAALGLYWVTNNAISLVQSRVMRREEVRNILGIPTIIKWTPDQLPMTNFQEQLKAEFNKQEKKKKDAANAVERNRIKIQEHENKIRGNLLAAFSKEDQERLERNARRRLGEKE